MTTPCKVEREIGGKLLSIETGRVARQAHGAVLVQYGETVVLVTVVTSAPWNPNIDFFPLTVEYRERHSAAGKFPGGFIKREGRPSTKEILTSRMIDRPIRPLFPEGYFQEVQIIASVLSADKDNDPDIPAMIGASAALSISKIPFLGPIGFCKLARIDGKLIVNPTYKELKESDINLLVAGRKEAINMIEVGSKQVSESDMADAIRTAHESCGEICDLIDELGQKVGVPEKVIPLEELNEELLAEMVAAANDRLSEAKQISDKHQRQDAVKALREEIYTAFCEAPEDAPDQEPKCAGRAFKRLWGKIEKGVVRDLLLQGKRSDGRGYGDLRDISCEVGVLPRTHGSALFTRGETQSLVTVTLGTVRDAQIIDGLQDEYAQRFVLHYNFPPFSVGEVKPIRGVGRREIGHGALAERSLEPVQPPIEDFAYTVRIISDITESNGSSSMASVCGGCLALMDAGVPVIKPVAGISIGMVSDDNGRYELLTDIIGEEDHFGDMDFKVSGTTDGITGIQLDIKAEGLAHDIMVESLEQARVTRLKILDIMNATISEPRAEMSVHAPKLISVMIDPDLIGKLIGPGGKMIKSIQEQTETTIEIEEDGTVFISCVGGDGYLRARDIVQAMTQPPEIGRVYPQSKVVSVKDFGVFVEIIPGVEGLCHISELSDGYIKSVEQVCKMGDLIPVKLVSTDDQGRLKLSRKAALAEIGDSSDSEEGESEKKD